jgi:adenylosuccinate synthase
MSGWKEPIEHCASFEELPDNAKRYVKRVEELVGVPVGIISTGPRRDSTLIMQNPFER